MKYLVPKDLAKKALALPAFNDRPADYDLMAEFAIKDEVRATGGDSAFRRPLPEGYVVIQDQDHVSKPPFVMETNQPHAGDDDSWWGQ